VPSSLAVLRWLSLPNTDGLDRRAAAEFKVKKHLPFPVDQAYVEASPPDPDDREGMGQALVIAIKREIIDSRAEAVEAAGMIPVGAELEAQAILRVVERRLNEQSVLWRDASLTILDVGGSNTHMYVVQNQRLQFIRGVKFGANLFATAVSTALEVPFSRAEDLISLPTTLLTDDGMLIVKSDCATGVVNVQAELDKLTREFLRLLRYFRSLHPERSYAGILDHVIICGGLVGLQGFGDYLQNALGLRVERARPFAGMIAKFKKETFQSISSRQEAFTVVMGLALSGLGKRVDKQGVKRAGREFAWARGA
jgi:type IV pilus assembly protein PilM